MQIKVEHTKTHTAYLFNEAPVNVTVIDAELVLVESSGQTNIILVNQLWVKPILISRSEKIEVGDWIYQHNTKVIHKVTSIANDLAIFGEDGLFTPIGNCDKILALPEHFSPKHLQDIVDGKLKGKYLVECEYWDREKYDNFGNYIKLNPYITIYPVEEKMVPISLVKKAFEDAHRVTIENISGREWEYDDENYGKDKKKWFEQNVK